MAQEFKTDRLANQASSFQSLMRLWQSQRYAAEVTPLPFLNSLTADPVWQQLAHTGPGLTWILDVRTGAYRFMSHTSKWFTGHSPELLLQGGIAQMQSLLYPDDADAYWQLMRRVWKFLLALPAQQRRHYQFSCDYRFQKKSGTIIRVLEQNSVLQTDKNGNIILLLGTCLDITHWKKSAELVASVYAPENEVSFLCTSADETNLLRETLSKREKEVLKLVAAGYSSKHIADQLCISMHTVNTHRKKMIEKTNTKNTGELVQHAFSNRLI